MHTIYPALSEESIEGLIALRGELPMVESLSLRRRMGENGANNLSEYMNTRWFTWTQEQRLRFRQLFPDRQHEKSLVSSFLELPPKTGHLDRMTYWQTTNSAGTMLSYSLWGDQEILLNDKPVVVKRGEGIGFNLRNIHQINKSDAGQLWACVMVLGDPESFKP